MPTVPIPADAEVLAAKVAAAHRLLADLSVPASVLVPGDLVMRPRFPEVPGILVVGYELAAVEGPVLADARGDWLTIRTVTVGAGLARAQTVKTAPAHRWLRVGNLAETSTPELVCVGWDGRSDPMWRYRDDLPLPEHARRHVAGHHRPH